MAINSFAIGISALSVSQRALELVGQNIANSNTVGYSRQRIDLQNTTAGGPVGTGVSVKRFTRYEVSTITAAKRTSTSDLAALTARLDSRRQIESALRSAPSGIGDQLDTFFAKAAALTTRPTDITSRRELLSTADNLARQLNGAAADIDLQKANVGRTIDQAVAEVNTIAKQIADLNDKIAEAEGRGDQPNDYLDQRDQLITDLSQRVDVQVTPLQFGSVNILSGNTPVVVGDTALQFAVSTVGTQKTVTTTGTPPVPVTFNSGTIAGALQEYNTDIPATRARLDAVAAKFIQQVDQIQATGIALTGPRTTATASRGVTDPTALLSTQNLPIPVVAGQLVVSVTNTGTGTRTNNVVAIDPATQSLNDVAAAITAATGGNVQATVDVPQNTLRFQAQPGFSFDFAARPSTPPQNVNIGGTAVPTVGGAFTGSANDNYTFQINGTGTIGTTPGLSLTVTNAASQVIATLNVGQGYTPGTPLAAGNGITVSLTAGTTTNGSFQSALYAPPDAAGLLGAFGVSGVFSGSSATDIAVRPEVLADPTQLALSRTGQPGDSTNAKRLADVQDKSVFGTNTLHLEYLDIAGQTGAQVAALGDQSTSQSGVQQSLFNQEQAVVGVDQNEETLNLMNYQRMVQAASKYLSVVNTALDSIIAITL